MISYLYIYTFYRSWSSCDWATYPSVILYTLVYFSLNWFVSVIRIHDKYQSLILIGLALTGKASSGIQYISFQDISEVVLSFSCPGKCLSLLSSPSLVLFLLLLFFLLLLLLLWIFTCKGFYYNSGYRNKPGSYYGNGYENKPRHFNKQKLLPCHMLCFPLLLLALLSLSLSTF